MDDEIKKTLKKMLDALDIVEGTISNKISEAFEQPCEISIKKNGKTTEGAEYKLVGSGLAILVTLAGLEKAVLEKLDPPTGLYKMIKEMTGVREAGDNE